MIIKKLSNICRRIFITKLKVHNVNDEPLNHHELY